VAINVQNNGLNIKFVLTN